MEQKGLGHESERVLRNKREKQRNHSQLVLEGMKIMIHMTDAKKNQRKVLVDLKEKSAVQI